MVWTTIKRILFISYSKVSRSREHGIILGCTEMGLLIKHEDVCVPVFDTIENHAIAAVEQAITEQIKISVL